MRTVLITSATAEPVGLGDMKRHLRLSTSTGMGGSDSVITGFISAARRHIEDYTSRKLLTQTWQVNFDKWPSDEYFDMPYPPLLGIFSSNLTYKDTDGTTNRIWSSGSNQWEVDTVSEPGRLHLKYGEDWPTATLYNVNPITIKFICGYGTTDAGDPTQIPEGMKLAVKLIVGHYYENRENTIVGQTVKEIPEGAKGLLYPYRIWNHQV